MEGTISTSEVNGVTIQESPSGTFYHLIYENDGKIVFLSEGDFGVSTTKNYYCATTEAEIQAVIDAQVLFYDTTSEISEDCESTFFED
jgi:hypothetical protein